MTDRPERSGSGLAMALLAYLSWGVLPLYFRLLHAVPPLELVAWRIVMTVPVCLAIIAVRGQVPEFRAALRQRRVMLGLAASATLIGGNWLIYVAAINSGHVLAASLGYYINPLLNVLLGTAVLGEKLSRTQWIAVAIAASGIGLLVSSSIATLGVALALAATFAGYGLIRKTTPVGSVPGLTIETILLFPIAVGLLAMAAGSPQGVAMGKDAVTTAALVAAGVITGVPLLMFAVAARGLDLSVLAFIQFLSPTIMFVLGLAVFGESLDPVRLVCFLLIWTAVAVFSWDLIRRRRRA